MKGLLLVLAVLALSCTPAASSPATVSPTAKPESVSPTAAVFVPTASATPTEGGCGSTTVLIGGIPDTLAKWAGDNAPSGVPYAVAHPATAAGFLFGHPLHTPSSANKILWVVGAARTGPLVIDGVPLGKTAPTVHYSFPANSGPGEIYPSGVDVPEPGCWAFTLRFGAQSAAIELAYR